MYDNLFTALECGDNTFSNRIFMAPLTRNRAGQPGDVPTDLNVEYYRQRASAGLIISEASQISPSAKGYPATPGCYSEEQVQGWKKVTDAVHREGGKIFLQLWHVGRISHPDFQPDGEAPLAPSAIQPAGQAVTDSGMKDFVTPRELTHSQIQDVVADYRMAARNAHLAGFDGVEVHAANGYLIDQFLRDGTNKRSDQYGGSLENRLRFGIEVIEAVCEELSPGKVGVRISPYNSFNDMQDSSPRQTFTKFAAELSDRKIAYLHVVEGELREQDPGIYSDPLFSDIREQFSGVYIGNGFYSAELASARIESSAVDAVAFGRLFISNPDLPARFSKGAELNTPDQATFYGGDEKGYTDYPFLSSP